VFGGSGPLHGARIARKLRVPQVICPNGAGVMSALGLLSSPVGFEVVQSLRITLRELDAGRFEQIVHGLERRVRAQLAESSSEAASGSLAIRLDMRYVGQGYEVEVEVGDPRDPEVVGGLAHAFMAAYAAVFGISFEDKEVEIVAWKVEVRGPTPGGDAAYRLRQKPGIADIARKGSRPAYFADIGYADTAVYDRYALDAGTVIDGPALIEEDESTCVIAPGDQAVLDAHGNLIINIGGA